MVVEHVPGRNAGQVMLYALSTCVWCKKTRISTARDKAPHYNSKRLLRHPGSIEIPRNDRLS